MNNFFDKVLHHFGRKKENLDVLVIGAMDGVTFDESRGYINMYGWSGLFVEPMDEMFNRLIKSFENTPQASTNKYEKSAISDKSGEIEMIYIPPEIVDSGLVHQCFNGMSAVYPPKNGLGSVGDSATVEKYAKRTMVNCLTLQDLLKKHNITNIDFVSIDAEGHDFIIVNQFDFSVYRPKLFRCEYINMSDDEKEKIIKIFSDNGYVYEILGQNIDGIPEELFKELSTIEPTAAPNEIKTISNTNHTKNRITYVTALYDMGRGDISDSFKRSFDQYKEAFSKLLKLDHINLVVYCDVSLNGFINSHRKNNIKIVNRPLESLKSGFAFFDKVQEIRGSQRWKNQAGWLPESPQSTLEFYNPLNMSKQFMLNDASIHNYFSSEYFCWIDAGLANTVNLNEYLNADTYPKFEKMLSRKLNKMLYLCFPYDGQVEVHGFTKAGMNRWAGANTEYVARGGFFGGNKYSINKINELYYHLLDNTLSAGEMGTEESIFTLLTYKHPELCNKHMIESNGLVYKFFEDVHKEIDNNKDITTELAFYSLVYNAPEQFELWIESFKKVYPEDFNSHKKYVINNSTNASDIVKYNKLFEMYDFEVIYEGDNIGIQDGRQFCATHFNNSAHDYYVFFEEDFLFVGPNDQPQVKDGFVRHIPKLFDKSINILKNNDLDFLRLTIIEFFGNNIYDWSFKNLPQDKRDAYFPVRADGNEDLRWKSKVDYMGIYDNVAYAVGHFHYSNWPILFCKRGNKQVFLDITYDHLYEQTMMSQAKMFMMDGKLKVGTIMGAPIYHDRKHHYVGKTRRENRHYTN